MDVLVLHWLKWITISVAVLIVVVLIAAFFGAEPLRQYIERSASEAVKGYHVRIGTLDLHPRTLSVDLRDVAVRREARPDPPLARYSGNRDRCSTDSLLAEKVAADLHLLAEPLPAVDASIKPSGASDLETTGEP